MFTHAKKRRALNRAFAFVLSLALMLSGLGMVRVQAAAVSDETANVTSETVSEGNEQTTSGDNKYVLDVTTDLTAMAAGAKADGDTEKAGTEDYFTAIYSATSKVDGSNKSFDDGYAATQRFNMGGKTAIGDTTKNAVMFETDGAATVKVWWVAGGDGREMEIFNSDGTSNSVTAVGATKNSLYISEFALDAAGKYYLGSSVGSNYIFKVEVTVVAPKEYILDATTDLTAMAAGTKADGDTEKAGTEDYFTVIYSASSKVDGSNKSFDDGYAATQRFNMGGKTAIGDTTKNAIMFETGGAATVKVWWVAGGDGREMEIFNSDGTSNSKTAVGATKNGLYISEFTLDAAGKYYLGSSVGSNYIFKVQVTTGGSASKPPRADWSTVAAPELVSAVAGSSEGTIDVTVKANVGHDGGDEVVITMSDEEGNEIASLKSIAEKDGEHIKSFVPDKSGTYTFTATLSREGEESKVAEIPVTYDFVLPLETPNVTGANNLGGGKVNVMWTAVPEAEEYVLSAEGTNISTTTTELSAQLEGLTVGETYTLNVVAVRGEDESAPGTLQCKVVDEVQRLWNYSVFGESINTTDNFATGSVYEDNLTLTSKNGKGKIRNNSTDGLGFYYTVVDPETENFTISADFELATWKPNSNQQGFGIMAADTVGVSGDASVFWTNSYMAIASKVEYNWDATAKKVVASGGDLYSMKMGVGSLVRTGVTSEDVTKLASGAISMPANFKTETKPLELSAPSQSLPAGTYNIAGNCSTATGATDIKSVTKFHMELTRNNTGYIVSYTDENGDTMSELYYHADDCDELCRIDADNIYVGFFTSRDASVKISNVEFTTINPADDAPAQERPVDKVTPSYEIESATTVNNSDYEFVFLGNADGKITITGPAGKVVENADVTANVKYKTNISLSEGANAYKVTFTPNADYKPSEYEVMESYEAVQMDHVVTYKVNNGGIIYVAPDAPDNGDGTKEDPMSIQNAMKYAAPGQAIFVMEGTYTLNDGIIVDRGINGTEKAMIYLVADPEANTRPVFDFNKNGSGIVIGGDYWYLQGFDVTNTANGKKGLQISGDNCIVDQVNTYRNGNTGIQISRLKTSDTFEDWPSNNLILNCTSYLNADVGYNDADGFAAKLTVGEGNVFDGCIAAYNADDGWDLYAKVETGSIGKVTVKNSIAFRNGVDIDADGKEIGAGNGNGFKLGGESLAGGHVLENSIAFENAMKGIDSNSCPDIKVYNCTSFNNGNLFCTESPNANVALYTNNAANTAFYAQGIISYQTDGKTFAENIKPKGTQNQADIYGDTNYYWNGSVSTNTSGTQVADNWFVSLDTEEAIRGNEGRIFRNADGTINMNGYLELTENAPADAGARMTGTPSLDITEVDFDDTIPNNRPGTEPDPEPVPEPEPQPNPDTTIAVSYRTHIQSYGWEGREDDITTWKKDGAISGTSGKSKRLEGINIAVNPKTADDALDLGIQYTTHCQSYGWLPWSANGEMNGTEGEAKRMEAIKIQLTGKHADLYDVYYRVHAQTYGWLGWAKNGAPAGTAGYAKRLEAIQIVVVKKGESIDQKMGNITSANPEAFVAKKGDSPILNYPATSNTNPVVPGADSVNVAYKTHVQTYGWQTWKYNGQLSGTTGKSKRLEAINIELKNKDCSGDIVYTTHVQTYGWQGSETDQTKWYKNGQMAGTSGKAKRLEAIRINLTGEMAEKYDIYYRVHAQSYGWLGWAKNGAPAGTAGYAKRLEGIQIVLVPKGGAAPGNYQGIVSTDSRTYVEKK